MPFVFLFLAIGWAWVGARFPEQRGLQWACFIGFWLSLGMAAGYAISGIVQMVAA